MKSRRCVTSTWRAATRKREEIIYSFSDALSSMNENGGRQDQPLARRQCVVNCRLCATGIEPKHRTQWTQKQDEDGKAFEDAVESIVHGTDEVISKFKIDIYALNANDDRWKVSVEIRFKEIRGDPVQGAHATSSARRKKLQSNA